MNTKKLITGALFAGVICMGAAGPGAAVALANPSPPPPPPYFPLPPVPAPPPFIPLAPFPAPAPFVPPPLPPPPPLVLPPVLPPAPPPAIESCDLNFCEVPLCIPILSPPDNNCVNAPIVDRPSNPE